MKTAFPLLLLLLYVLPIPQTVSVSDSMITDPDATDFTKFGTQAATWTCHPFCKTCTGTSNNECTSCNYPYFKYPNTTCLDTCVDPFTPTLTSNTCVKICTTTAKPYYVQHTKTCSATCTSPLISNSDGLCSLPCGTEGYLYSDGSCSSDCDALLQQGTTFSGLIKTCTSPCTNYLYFDGSCQTDCPAPLLTKSMGGVQYCYNPCAGAGDYLYPDGSCIDKCESPLVTESGVDGQYCKSSCSSDYIYPDGSCLTDCEFPLVAEDIGGISFCKQLCSGYLYPDNSCLANCESPLFSEDEGSISYCRNPCFDTNNYLYPDDSCFGECLSPLEIKQVAGISYCKNSCPDVNDYIYPDNSCFAQCASPLQADLVSGIPYCNSPCPSAADYVYPDHSCLAGCEPPLIVQHVGGIPYCKNSCPGYFYPDDSCLAQCESPLVVEYVGGISYCISLCSDYLYPDNSCLTDCVSPMIIKKVAGVQYCKNPCPDVNDYMYPDGSCSAECDAPLVVEHGVGIQYCKTPCTNTNGYVYPDDSCVFGCESPLVVENVAGIEYCKSSCAGANDYIYPDDSCLDNCESPLIVEDVGGVSYCKNPCSGYLYPDDSCLAECQLPLGVETKAGVSYCKNPCSDYTYPDGSCLAECESPLVVEHTAGVQYCKSPCSNVDDYVYPDGSCNGDCPLPLSNKTELNVKYCFNPCSESNKYLASNQCCQDTCPSPSTIKTESIAKFCVFPCENLEDYYYEKTGKCQTTCESPNTAVDSPLPKICKAPKSALIIEDSEPKEDEPVEKITKITNKANTVLSAGVFSFTIMNPLDSTLALIGLFSKMLRYIKYMKIDYPEKVQLMLREQNDDFQDFPNKIAPHFLQEFPEHQLPEKFELYSTPSSFFVNFWSTLFKLSVILFVTLVVIVITLHRKKSSKPVDGALKILADAWKWNLFLTFFCSNIGDIVLYTALEMRTLQLDNAAAVISFLWCLAVNLGSLYVVFKILDITWALRKLKRKVTPLDKENKDPEKKWASCQTLFAPYQDRWYYQQIFLFIFLVRVGLFNGMLGYLFEYPLLQASTFVIFGILMLAFLIVKRPIKDRVSLIMGIVFELVLLPFNLCVLILAIMDKQGIEDYDQRSRLGDVMIYIHLIAPFLAIAMTATKAYFLGRDFYREPKAQRSNKVKKLNAKAIYPEVALDETQEILPHKTTKIIRSRSTVERNLFRNSQKIDDWGEEPSPTPSPESSSLLSNNRFQRISVIGKKSSKRDFLVMRF